MALQVGVARLAHILPIVAVGMLVVAGRPASAQMVPLTAIPGVTATVRAFSWPTISWIASAVARAVAGTVATPIILAPRAVPTLANGLRNGMFLGGAAFTDTLFPGAARPPAPVQAAMVEAVEPVRVQPAAGAVNTASSPAAAAAAEEAAEIESAED